MNSTYILSAVILIILAAIIIIYNKGIVLKNYVKEAFSTMDVYLKKRWDLIPNLIETVKAYNMHEKDLLTNITQLRNTNYSGLNDDEIIDTNSKLDVGLSKLIAVAENYPDLKANQNFIVLMEQLSLVEDEIASARKYYNGTVRELNTFTEVFPSNIICMLFAVKPAKLFEISERERENIKVEF